MQKETLPSAICSSTRRLPKAERRKQLLDTALLIVREEGADRLTLGYLSVRAGVSKPVVYDHFDTRSSLLIELYRCIDIERVNAFRDAMSLTPRSLEETAQLLASAYIQCAGDTTDEFYAIGAALAGSEEKAAVFQELLDNCVQMFIAVLKPHAAFSSGELERRCTGLVGAGEALSGALVRGRYSKDEVIDAFASLIRNALSGTD
ncbi:TetR/AcrR family transcriptional regulator [Pseudomonas sp. WAC2]|uniref:TetR/AcrR family transcriptional regulator n=1 Tax=Pseudomonas sp. WAC2 TaxID=3055057 RepID=UPI0025AF05D7|nr:TetR/AcrR family transcriptional regulator [Pseudomonas sp. WAC2]MDN3235552.1 TetR/AcrR family transcriptional regulator [Pseudomonas sp. WAC2]